MERICLTCGLQYDDFNHMTYCPHPYFAASPSAAEHLRARGIDPETGKRFDA
jgi:hypothetical protein